MINIRNLMYIKVNLNRPQYQFSIYWMKFYFKKYFNYLRNKCKHSEIGAEPMGSFKEIFNKCYISLSNI